MSYAGKRFDRLILRRSLLALLTLLLFGLMSLFFTVSPFATSHTSTVAVTNLPCGWNLVDSPSPDLDSNSLLSVAAVASNDVWAVGHYGKQPLAEHWDGSQWSVVPMPSPSSADLADVAAVASNDVWAIGIHGNDYRLLTEHWNGTEWSIIPSPNRGSSNYLRGVAGAATDDVWAVGYYYETSVSQTLIEHWDGQNWTIVPSPNANTNANVLYDVAAVSANNVWAVGFYATPYARTLIMRWDGIKWSIIPSPNPPGATVAGLESVAAFSASDIWAVGHSGDSVGNHQTLILHWDGSQWRIVPSPNAVANVNWLFGVAARASDDAWAVGYYCCPNVQGSLILHWDGASWSLVTHPDPGTVSNIFYGVEAISETDVWAVGQYWNGSGMPRRTFVERYSGPCPTATQTVSPTATVTAIATGAATATNSPTPTSSPCPMTFTDVLPTDYFYEAVRYLYCAGVISGYSDGTFRPYNNTTRAQLTKIVVLGFDIPLYTPPTPTFTDVPTTHTFYQYIETAAHEGLVSGYSDGTFRPQNDVTRGQLSKIAVEAAGWPLLNPPIPAFVDVPTTHTFYQHIETAYSHNIISGYADGTFRPANNATRGQISKIVYQAIIAP